MIENTQELNFEGKKTTDPSMYTTISKMVKAVQFDPANGSNPLHVVNPEYKQGTWSGTVEQQPGKFKAIKAGDWIVYDTSIIPDKTIKIVVSNEEFTKVFESVKPNSGMCFMSLAQIRELYDQINDVEATFNATGALINPQISYALDRNKNALSKPVKDLFDRINSIMMGFAESNNLLKEGETSISIIEFADRAGEELLKEVNQALEFVGQEPRPIKLYPIVNINEKIATMPATQIPILKKLWELDAVINHHSL